MKVGEQAERSDQRSTKPSHERDGGRRKLAGGKGICKRSGIVRKGAKPRNKQGRRIRCTSAKGASSIGRVRERETLRAFEASGGKAR